MSDKKFSIFDYISPGGLAFIAYVFVLTNLMGMWLMNIILG